MLKKLFFLIVLSFMLTGCSSDEGYIPTALITNIEYDSDSKELGFRLDITDKSETIEDISIRLSGDATLSIDFDVDNSQYLFSNILSDQNYVIKIYATYELNKTKVVDQVICSLDISNYVSTKEIYFSSRTVYYTGNSQSIYISNLPDGYTVEYQNNNQTNVGAYLVTATVYDKNHIQVQVLSAYLVITSDVLITANNQEFDYTGKSIELEYSLSYNVDHTITYNGSKTAPKDVGEYLVKIQIDDQSVSKDIIVVIKPIQIEITTTNKVVIYDDTIQKLEVITNVDCEYTITYSKVTEEKIIDNIKPCEPGIYNVEINVPSTKNYTGATKHLTLTIIDLEEDNNNEEIFISQIVYSSETNIIVELFNPTKDNIDLSNYSIVIGDISYNKTINLEGEISSLKTYTISTIKYSDISFDYITNYLVALENESISLYTDEIIDKVELGHSVNYVRSETVVSPNISFVSSEWNFYDNEIRQTVNNHYYLQGGVGLSYEVSYKDIIYINSFSNIDYNEYVIIYENNELLDSNDYCISSTQEEDVYSIYFEVGNYKFIVDFILRDIDGPVITLNDTNLTFSIDDEIDFESLITITDESKFYDPIVTHDTLILGANKITYTVKDVHGNTTSVSVYIFIV